MIVCVVILVVLVQVFQTVGMHIAARTDKRRT
jgi:ABC-type methionine transport system permease subunit